ncbi:hypothetical protein BKA56DRAFT_674187 [Ilyonectria sp. MPI-CAGE-AT-0026]|nr:hypothetical protein BKA56DRAFT_674187 [Ilyonectria sp. MPI-CAGE-AT-0026]
MGLSFDHVLQAIQHYAGQNKLFHKSILRYIENGEWCRLAEMLFRDLRDLPVVTPSHLRKNIPVMESIINAIVDEYFIRGDKERPFDPRDWRTRESAYEIATNMRVEGMRRKGPALEERKRIEKQAAKKCKVLIQKHSMVHPSAPVSKLDAPSGDLSPSLNRPISEVEIVTSMETIKRQKKARSQLVALQERPTRRRLSYCEEYGNIEEPIDPDFWLELAEIDPAGLLTSSEPAVEERDAEKPPTEEQ